MGDKDNKETSKPQLAHKFFFSEVTALNWDKTSNVTMVTCLDGTQYKFEGNESIPKLHAKVTVTVEIEL